MRNDLAIELMHRHESGSIRIEMNKSIAGRLSGEFVFDDLKNQNEGDQIENLLLSFY